MENKKRALFIDRDGTLIVEPPVDFQVDSLQKLEFIPGVLRNLHFIASTLDFELVMVTNQDGLGTPSFPTSDFLPPHEKMLQTFKGEGVEFDDIIIDRTFENEHKPTRKPGTALLGKYMDGSYDLENSFVIGDRITDIQLAKNLGAKGILLQNADAGKRMIEDAGLEQTCVLVAESWDCIADYLRGGARTAQVNRKTSETDIYISLDLDGHGRCDISTGLGFFDHMLNQIGRHSGFDLTIKTKGDLYVDEHPTVEDTALALGEALRKALGDKLIDYRVHLRKALFGLFAVGDPEAEAVGDIAERDPGAAAFLAYRAVRAEPNHLRAVKQQRPEREGDLIRSAVFDKEVIFIKSSDVIVQRVVHALQIRTQG